MSRLPFALVLSDLYGRSVTVATFRTAAELWAFWEAWRWNDALSGPEDRAAARFQFYGRAVCVTRPPADGAGCRDWALSVAHR